jgi:hypothetical protein
MNWLAKTFRALSPNCKEAIRLQSDALDRPLSRVQRLGLRIHLMLCVWCSRYGKQIKFLRVAAQHCDHEHEPALPPEAKERIRAQVKRALETGND